MHRRHVGRERVRGAVDRLLLLLSLWRRAASARMSCRSTSCLTPYAGRDRRSAVARSGWEAVLQLQAGHVNSRADGSKHTQDLSPLRSPLHPSASASTSQYRTFPNAEGARHDVLYRRTQRTLAIHACLLSSAVYRSFPDSTHPPLLTLCANNEQPAAERADERAADGDGSLSSGAAHAGAGGLRSAGDGGGAADGRSSARQESRCRRCFQPKKR